MAAFVRRVCADCGCPTRVMTDCGIDGCELAERPDLDLLDAIHDHCTEHPLCSSNGCPAVAVPLRQETTR